VIEGQVADLRNLFGRPLPRQEQPRRRCRSIAISSGKGGVGKTNLVVNLAVVLSGLGARVLVVDADLSLANADVLMGVRPAQNVADALAGRRGLEEVVTTGPLGVALLPGASGLTHLADLPPAQRTCLLDRLAQLEASVDMVLIDTGAGIGATVRDFAAAAGEVLVVTTPEPSAIADAYALVKVVHQEAPRTRFGLVVNQVSSRGEAAEVARKVTSVARRFLGLEITDRGHLPADPMLPQAVMRQMPVVIAYPHSPASLALTSLGEQLWRESKQAMGYPRQAASHFQEPSPRATQQRTAQHPFIFSRVRAAASRRML